VFAAGLSNGAGMVYRLACQRPDLVAAIAPVSIIAMHGTADPIVPFGDWFRNDLATWTRRDGCPAAAISSQLADVDPTDGTRTRVETFGPCAAGTAVAAYTIEGGGHAWPGGDTPFTLGRRGNTARDFDAGEVIWDFFQKHPRR